MPAFVLDASVAVAGIAPDERHPDCLRLIDMALDNAVAVPAIWFYEVVNIFDMKLKRGLIDRKLFESALLSLRDFRIEADASSLLSQCAAASKLAQKHGLSVYDAAYLELAARLRIPIATLDKALGQAARREAIQVLP